MTSLYCKNTIIPGELKTHREIIKRLRDAVDKQKLSFIIVFPTISLLEFVQDEFLSGPDMHGYGGIRFLLFEGFINEIGTQLGLCTRKPSLPLQNLMLGRCCQELDHAGRLPSLHQIPFNNAFRVALLDGIAEWKRSGFSTGLFSEWACEKGEREQELAQLYQKYQELLVAYGFSEEDMLLDHLENRYLETAAAGVRDEKTPPHDVILYGFHDLTPLQNDFIKALNPWCRFEAIIDPTPVREFQEFSAGCLAIKPAIPASPGTANSRNALQMLQDNLWITAPQIQQLSSGDQSVQLLQTAGSIREVTGIARAIQNYYASNPGPCLNKVLIITPEPQNFIKKAKSVFTEYQLFLNDTVEPVREFPVVKLVTQSYQAVAGDWQWRDVITYLSLAYPGTQIQDIDRFICFLGERYGAITGRKRWQDLTAEIQIGKSPVETGFAIQQFGTAIEFLTQIPEQATLETYLCNTLHYLHEGIRHFCQSETSFVGDTRLESSFFRNIQAAQLLMNALREIRSHPDLLGDLRQELSLKEFMQFYKEYLLELELEPLPSRRAPIRVIHPREARGIRAALVFITGLEQGHCPRSYVNDWKIGPKARLELKALGIEMETGAHYQIQEKLAFYWALQTALEKLVLVYQEQDENGQPQNRSSFLEEIIAWFPDLAERAVRYPLSPTLPSRLADCYSNKEIEGRLALELILPRQSPVILETAPSAAGNASRDFDPEERSALLALLQQPIYQQLAFQIQAWTQRIPAAGSPLFKNQTALHYLSRRFGSKTVFPVTNLEDYLRCPLRFCLKHVFRIKPLTRPVIRPGGLDLGILCHQVLHDFYELQRQQGPQSDGAANDETTLRSTLEHVFQEWREKAPNDLELLFLEVQAVRIWKILRKWLLAEHAWRDQTGGQFRFALLEFAFGFLKGDYDPDSTEEPFLLTAGPDRIRIAGKIDRVDADPKGRFIVYDYKLGMGPAGKELLNLKQLQIPIYLMALEQLKYEPGCGIGGAYLGLANPSRWNGGVWRAAALPPARESQTFLNDDAWEQWLQNVRRQVAGIVGAIRSGQFAKAAAECPSYCEYRESCRRQDWEVDDSGESTAESGAE